MNAGHTYPIIAGARSVSNASSHSDAAHLPYYKDKPLMSTYDLLTPSASNSRRPSPLSHPAMTASTHTDEDATNNYFAKPAKNLADFVAPVPSKELPTPEPAASVRPNPRRSDTSKSINRKPVPTKQTPTQSRSRSPGKTSPTRSVRSSAPSIPHTNSLNDQYVDEDALAKVLARSQTMTSASQTSAYGDERSVADDDSTYTPDYASTRKSTETKRSERSIEKPRRGKLKTVGNVPSEVPQDFQVGDATYRPGHIPGPVEASSDIPSFDFGTTHIYDPTQAARPGTSGTLTQDHIKRAETPERMTPSPVHDTPVEINPPRGSPQHIREKSQSRNLTTPEPQLRGPSPSQDNRRSVVWQPGVQVGGSPGSRSSITPEQFVQQRAQAGRITPIFAHARQKSASPTPALGSKQSPDEGVKSGRQKLQKRNSSYGHDIPSRPGSRTASRLMNVSGDYSAHLTAREQEHVAKVAGGPLLNNVSNPRKLQKPQEGGLIGAISAREREKQDIKEGYGGQMVQQAIAHRQQSNQQQNFPKRHSSYGAPTQSYAMPQPSYAMPGGFPPSPVSQTAFPTTPSPTQGWNSQQQHQQYYQQQQYPQQQPAWSPPSAGQLVGTPQNSQYQQYTTQGQYFQNPQNQGAYGQQGYQQQYHNGGQSGSQSGR